MSKNKKTILLWLLPLLSGVLIGTSYIPFPPWALFFCYVPLWYFALKQNRIIPLVVAGFLCQFVLTLIGCNWVAYTIKEFGFFPWHLAVLGLVGFASFANLHIVIALVLWFYLKKLAKKTYTYMDWLLLPTLFALCHQYYPMIFEWHLGYTWFFAGWPMFQTAEIWGFRFIHTIILFFNLLLLFVLTKITTYKAQAIWGIKIGIIILGFLHLWGKHLQKNWHKPTHKAHALIVQANIKNKDQRKPFLRPFIVKKLLQQTKKALTEKKSPIDFILWSEGAYPYSIKASQKNPTTYIKQIVQMLKKPLVLSAISDNNGTPASGVFVFNQKAGLVSPPYNKTILLAFGEYMPLEKWLPISKWLKYYGRSFYKGTGAYQVTRLNNINLGFQICYEGLFDYFTRNMMRADMMQTNMMQTTHNTPHILVNVTNDSWFGWWQEPWQHLYMTLARAIEVRKPLIRSTNSGISAVISAKGDIQTDFIIHKEWSKVVEVPYHNTHHQTIFVKWGYYINDLVLWSLVFIYLIVTFLNYNFQSKIKKPHNTFRIKT